jgi:hypothetical protein
VDSLWLTFQRGYLDHLFDILERLMMHIQEVIEVVEVAHIEVVH